MIAQSSIFTAATVLLINIWGESSRGGERTVQMTQDLTLVRKCIEMLETIVFE